MKSIYHDVLQVLKKENTKIGRKAFDVLNREGIADIVMYDGTFWFESYVIGNDCPNIVYQYLVRKIKRKFHLRYLGEFL